MSRMLFRWGIPEWDDKGDFTLVPNLILKYYSKVPWVDVDGKEGQGITNQEMMFILHLASFKYESVWGGPARPSLSTLKRRMGYAERRSVIGLKDSLIHKNLLVITEHPGQPHTYDFTPFSLAIKSTSG